MKQIINENERGLLFKKGLFIKMLMPGCVQYFDKSKEIKIVSLNDEFNVENYDLSVFMNDKQFASEIEVIDVKDETLVLHYVNDCFVGCLTRGRRAFWNVFDKHTFKVIDISNVEVSEDFPKYLFTKISKQLYTKVEVASYQKALLFIDKKLDRVLESGTYYFWNNGTEVTAQFVDTRLQQMELCGQEMLTQDKVTLRINFVCRYTVSDAVKLCTEIADFNNQMYVVFQQILREFVGKYRLDEILENKEQMSEYVYNAIKKREEEFFISIKDAGLKDIILPGEIRDIMNTVLIAEKRAQANVITRREEVASTRSLLNTAKLMDENQTLYKLKELEYLEKICENVGTITVNGGNGLLKELRELMKGA